MRNKRRNTAEVIAIQCYLRLQEKVVFHAGHFNVLLEVHTIVQIPVEEAIRAMHTIVNIKVFNER